MCEAFALRPGFPDHVGNDACIEDRCYEGSTLFFSFQVFIVLGPHRGDAAFRRCEMERSEVVKSEGRHEKSAGIGVNN